MQVCWKPSESERLATQSVLCSRTSTGGTDLVSKEMGLSTMASLETVLLKSWRDSSSHSQKWLTSSKLASLKYSWKKKPGLDSNSCWTQRARLRSWWSRLQPVADWPVTRPRRSRKLTMPFSKELSGRSCVKDLWICSRSPGLRWRSALCRFRKCGVALVVTRNSCWKSIEEWLSDDKSDSSKKWSDKN